MGILNDSLAITRFNAIVPPEGPDFDRVSFYQIDPGSEVRERAGIVPFEPEAPFEIAQGRYAFRVRVDRRKPDATAVKERVKELVRAEMEATGAPFVGPKTRKRLRELAEQELLFHQAPKVKIVECVLDGSLLYVTTTAKSFLGIVEALLRQAGVAVDFKAPWLDEAPEVDENSSIVLPREPGESVLGCRFLRLLLEDPEVMVEPEAGSVRLMTRDARISLAGGVLPELFRYLEQGAEILSAKLFLGTIPLRFEALSYRLQGLKLEPVQEEHWTLEIEARLHQIAEVWEQLDGKYNALKERLGETPEREPGGEPAPDAPAPGPADEA